MEESESSQTSARKGRSSIRGVILLHKGHTIERPLQFVCPLEIRCTTQVEERKNDEKNKPVEERKQRQAAIDARKRIRALAEED